MESTTKEKTTKGASKASGRSGRSAKSKKKGMRSLLPMMDHSSHQSGNVDPPSTNLEAMADCVGSRLEADRRRKKLKQSRILEKLAVDDEFEDKNDLAKSFSFHKRAPSREDNTLTTAVLSLADNEKSESRQPSSEHDRYSECIPAESFKTRTSSKHRGGGGEIDIGVVELKQSGSGSDSEIDSGSFRVSDQRRGGSKASSKSSRSNVSADSSHNPANSVAASRKTVSTAANTIRDFQLSSERLEVLVMQLRDTSNEKEAATIVLEFALRIKNHELVVQGADLSIINAMKRFSNSHKIQMRGCKALAEMATKGMPNILSIIDKGGADIILTAMAKHRAEEDLQKEACRAIEYITKDNVQGKESFGPNAKDGITSILHAMKDHANSAKLQRMACRALASIADESPQCSQCMLKRGGVDSIRRTLKNHDDNSEVIESAFDALISTAASVTHSSMHEEIAQIISMDRVLATMILYRKNDRMQCLGMALLCILCKESHRNRSKIATLYGLEVIMKSLEICLVNKEVQRNGTTLIQYLCHSEGNNVAAGMATDGGMELLLNILRRHGSDPIVVQQVSLVIAKMARPFSDTVRKEGGIELILSGMQRHETIIRVQEAACFALWKLSAKTENANVINGNGGVALINSALARFPADQNLSDVACEALASLSHDKQLLQAQQTLKARAVHKKNDGWGMWSCGAVSCI